MLWSLFNADDGGEMNEKKIWFERSDWQSGELTQEEYALNETILACLRDTEGGIPTDSEKSAREYLEHLLGFIQGYLGCQGIGLFGKNGNWQPVIKLGGRSLGKPEPEWLDETFRRDACGFAPDIPAPGWGQIVCPLRVTFAGLSLEMLVLSGRSIREDSLFAVSRLVQFLEKIWRLLDQAVCSQWKARSLLQLNHNLTDLLLVNSVQELIELLSQQSTTLMDCERTTVFIRDFRTGQLLGSSAPGLQSQNFVIPENAGITGQVVQTGKPLLIDDVQADSRFECCLNSPSGFRTKNILCVPLLDERQVVLGVVECLNKSSGHFSLRDQSLLELLARHAAVLIDKTRITQDLMHRQNKMRTEISEQCKLIGQNAAVQSIRSHVLQLCDNVLPVLITGEAGTGKRTVAQAIHYRGSRSEKPFCVIRCAELNGPVSDEAYEATGQHRQAPSRLLEKIEQAEGGTLYLDDISRLNTENQEMVLNLLEQQGVDSFNGKAAQFADVRIIASAESPLSRQVLSGTFREDLYYRLAVVCLEIPSLRERFEDLPLLVDHFLGIYRKISGTTLLSCSDEAIQELLHYSWPGNVRELKNVIERIAFFTRGNEISPENIMQYCGVQVDDANSQQPLGLTEATLEFQKRFIRQAIARQKGNMTSAARSLGLHRSNLYRKMSQLKMAEAGEDQ